MRFDFCLSCSASGQDWYQYHSHFRPRGGSIKRSRRFGQRTARKKKSNQTDENYDVDALPRDQKMRVLLKNRLESVIESLQTTHRNAEVKIQMEDLHFFWLWTLIPE